MFDFSRYLSLALVLTMPTFGFASDCKETEKCGDDELATFESRSGDDGSRSAPDDDDDDDGLVDTIIWTIADGH